MTSPVSEKRQRPVGLLYRTVCCGSWLAQRFKYAIGEPGRVLAKNGDDIFCSDDKASQKSTHLFIAPPARLALKSGSAVRPLW